MNEWLNNFFLAWVPLFVAIDPLGMAALFLGLTSHMEEPKRRRIAREATITGLAVGVAFMFGGRMLLGALGITVADFLVAGGLILLIIGARSLLEHEQAPIFHDGEFGVVPLGMPLIAGPAMLTALLALTTTRGVTPTLAALLVNLGLNHVIMIHVRTISGYIGINGIKALSKIISLLLVAIAVNMIRRGWQNL